MSFTAVVMAAGQGTRMRSATPKVLHELCGRPMVLWPVTAARAAGASRVVVVQGADRALDGHLPDDVVLAVQPEPDGTGGAVAAALDHVDQQQALVVLSGDVPLVSSQVIEALLIAHARSGDQATMLTTRLADPTGYGRVVRSADGHVLRVVETKAHGDATPEQLAIDEVNTGIFCFEPAPLADALDNLGYANAQGERYLPQVLEHLGRTGALLHPDASVVLGVNDRVQLAELRAVAHARILQQHLRGGVTIVDPAQTTIDVDVRIDPDCTLEPGTTLKGTTSLGTGTVVGPQSTIIDTTTGAGCALVHTYANGATLGDGVRVGPFAYLRPDAHLRDGAKIGTFVEVKNSDIGAGAKVPHLSYIGDADVGEGTNLGASTITANYDGQHKHRTTIGARVKSSVHVSFVAPVTVGDDAYTAASSAITEDVPDGALGVARPRQTNIEGYAARRREDRP